MNPLLDTVVCGVDMCFCDINMARWPGNAISEPTPVMRQLRSHYRFDEPRIGNRSHGVIITVL
jgi:hypothetical protein